MEKKRSVVLVALCPIFLMGIGLLLAREKLDAIEENLRSEMKQSEALLANSFAEQSSSKLHVLEEELGRLRRLVWSTSAANKKLIAAVADATGVPAELVSFRDSEESVNSEWAPCCGGEEEALVMEHGISEVDSVARIRREQFKARLQEYREALNEEEVEVLAERTEERLNTMLSWSLKGLSEDQRTQLLGDSSALKKLDETMRKSVEDGVLLEMFSASRAE